MKLLNHVVSLFVILIIALIIIPLPASLLDMMFIINISLSLVILLLTMYIKQALDFSVFPSILLITTLFRLALNISSTRLILSHSGEAGQVIKTFGSFVLQGNIVVGFVVFLIIVLVQFLVITKGAERISEVAARFRLDAMPGKQMAIDADLNSGLIDEQTARKRREDIQREAEFYGSMDGASKFVKGDAIMSIVITFINFIGGLLVGMVQGGKSFGEVLNIYSIATVGDGLVSQVPALLISTATGMIVTRAASNSTLGADVSRQFSSQSMVILLAGCGIFALNLIPGMPHPQLILFSAFLIGSGLILRRRLEQSEVPVDADCRCRSSEAEQQDETAYYKNIDHIYELLPLDPIEMEFGYSLIPLVDESSGSSFIERLVSFRKQFAVEMGMVVPSVRLRDNGLLNPNQYVIKIKGEEVARGEILVDYLSCIGSRQPYG
jgi:flagellar biosynthesis protein FlhA